MESWLNKLSTCVHTVECPVISKIEWLKKKKKEKEALGVACGDTQERSLRGPISDPIFCGGGGFVLSACLSESRSVVPTLGDPMDCSPPGFSVHGILQARILEWVAMPSPRGSSQPRDRTQVSRTAGGFFTS